MFTVKEANWTMNGVEIKAYDNMVKLDKSCSIKTMQGSIYTFLSMAAYACQVELAQSEDYIQSLPNGDIELTVFVDNDIETWRDLVAWCAQTTGTFAVMNRCARASSGETPSFRNGLNAPFFRSFGRSSSASAR